MFMHDVAYNNSNCTFFNIWTTNAALNPELELRNNLDLFVPLPKFEGFKRFPLYNFAKNWNEIGDMRFQNNRSIFKHWLKNHLLSTLE